jgi:hypothetical protein
VVAVRRQGVVGELMGTTGRAPGKVVGGETHPSGGTVWMRWRMLRAVAFNGGEAAPVMDDIDDVALQCRGRREKVRGESIWMERQRAVVLTDNGGRRRCSGGNQRRGGVSGGGSRRSGHVGGGEGVVLELWCGHGIERSEAPAASPNRQTREGEQERAMGGGGGRVGAARRKENGREGPDAAVSSADRGVGMALGGVGGGGSVRSWRRRAGEQVGAGWHRGLVVSGGVREEERKARQRGGGAPTGGPRPHSVGAWFKLGFKSIQKYSNGSNEI